MDYLFDGQIDRSIENSPMFDNMIPPSAKDVPLPQNLFSYSRRYFPKVFHMPWLRRTPCKNQHRNKAMEAIKEIVDESEQKCTNARRKFAFISNYCIYLGKNIFKSTKRFREKSSAKNSTKIPHRYAFKEMLDSSIVDLTTHYEADTPSIIKDTNPNSEYWLNSDNWSRWRSNAYCTTCHRSGHTSLICHRNAGKDVIRCYNCGKIGHLAVRCYNTTTDSSTYYPVTPPKDESKSKMKKVPKTKLASKKRTEEKTLTEAELKREKTGIELICKIMADRPLREETQRCHPQLYEEMLAIMLANITFATPM